MINVVLGTMTFGGSADLAQSEAIVGAAAECGITRLDTANMYTGGLSEEFIGQILQKRPGQFEVASKVGNPAGVRSSGGPLSAVAIEESVNASLKRLQLESLDLLYFHEPDRTTPIEESLAAVERLRQAGKVQRFGVSNYAAWQIEQVAQHCRENDYLMPTLSQQMYSLLARRVEHEYAEYAAVTGLDTIVYNPLAGGLLVRVMDLASAPDSGRFGQSALGDYYRERYWNEQQFAVVAALSKIADEAGLSLLELSIRWLLNQSVTQGILLGASKPEQVTQNHAALMNGPLPDDLAAACSLATESVLGSAPLYNR